MTTWFAVLRLASRLSTPVADREGRDLLRREVNPAESVVAVRAAQGVQRPRAEHGSDDIVGGTPRSLFFAVGQSYCDFTQTRRAPAIGVTYPGMTERRSNCFLARLAERFDVVIHIDETHADGLPARTPRSDGRELCEPLPHAV